MLALWTAGVCPIQSLRLHHTVLCCSRSAGRYGTACAVHPVCCKVACFRSTTPCLDMLRDTPLAPVRVNRLGSMQLHCVVEVGTTQCGRLDDVQQLVMASATWLCGP
jgi:hypothetical protein